MKAIIIPIAIVAIAVVVGLFYVMDPAPREPLLNDIHTHADFKVFLNGEEYDFNQTKYMTHENQTLSPFMHLHDRNGHVAHQHMSTITLDFLFESLGMSLDNTCFKLDNGTEYCSNENRKLRMFVNGEERFELKNFEFNDLDRILITYGTNDETIIKEQMDSVTDKACIESGTCPERGSPSDFKTCTTDGGCKA